VQSVTVQTWEELAVIVATEGPIVPVWTAARLHGVSDQALRDRIVRGTLRKWLVSVAVYVSLLEVCRRSRPLSPGQVVNSAYVH